MEITWRVSSREGVGGEGGKDTGNKYHKWQVENRQGEGKNKSRKCRSQRTYKYDPWT